MPILNVSVVLNSGELLPEETANKLADEAGRIIASASGTTWVKLQRIAPCDYAENDIARKDTPHPVFVEILKAEEATQSERTIESDQLAATFSSILNRPKANIHILYLPVAAGRIAFGGKLVV